MATEALERPERLNHPAEDNTVIPVAAGIIRDAGGRVLVQRRPDHAHAGGLWEFPGGKTHDGEERETALRRELAEELGIEVRRARPLIRVRYAYPEKTVLLDVWQVETYGGSPAPLEGQPLQWVAPEDLPALAMPAADRAIVNAVRLPPACLITSSEPRDDGAFLERLRRRLEQGIRLVQLRADRSAAALEPLTRRASELCERHGAWLIFNGDADDALRWGAHGVHLNSCRLAAADGRPVPENLWLSAACHDAQELARAAAIGADFVLVSPVRPTASHPHAEPIGFEGLNALCERAPMPVYALGGMRPGDRDRAWQAGAQGVAGISGFW